MASLRVLCTLVADCFAPNTLAPDGVRSVCCGYWDSPLKYGFASRTAYARCRSFCTEHPRSRWSKVGVLRKLRQPSKIWLRFAYCVRSLQIVLRRTPSRLIEQGRGIVWNWSYIGVLVIDYCELQHLHCGWDSTQAYKLKSYVQMLKCRPVWRFALFSVLLYCLYFI